MGRIDGLELLVHESGTCHQKVAISDNAVVSPDLSFPMLGEPRTHNPRPNQKIRGEYEASARSIEQHAEWHLSCKISSVPLSKLRALLTIFKSQS